MSKTLFWYVLKDLLKIFLMTSAVLAGIMSFGGLLKPLMQFGLNGWQVGQMLMYFMPATQTYSLPIAALFATTVVYGRLSADNELTACRAHGISFMTMAIPAFILGLVLALISLVCLSYVVPKFTLKVEKVAFQSLAEVVQKSIQRTHQLKLQPGFTVFAESAAMAPPPPGRPDDEIVMLYGPMFCLYEQDEKTRINVPERFFTARSAQVVIHQAEDHVEFTAYLDEGTAFPRQIEGSATLGGVGTAQVGPVTLDSPIRENTKFMDQKQLQEYYRDPTRSREVRNLYRQITQQEQEQDFINGLLASLRRDRQYVFRNGTESVTLTVTRDMRLPLRALHSKLSMISGGAARDIRLQRSRNDEVLATNDARETIIRVQADPERHRMRVEFQLEDVLAGMEGGAPGLKSFPVLISVPMSAELLGIERRGPEFYLKKNIAKADDLRGRLYRKLKGMRNRVQSEIHGRSSFAVSCLILVLVGCALGMMFKTGNYLTAFGISVVPALISIALVVTGQHVSENSAANALKLGLTLIWTGNVIVLALAVGLLGHLRRQ